MTDDSKERFKDREKPALSIPLWKGLNLFEERGRPIISADNLLRVLDHDKNLSGVVWYDSFYDRMYTAIGQDGTLDGQAWEYTDTEHIHLLTYMQGHLGIARCTDTVLRQAITAYAYRNRRNAPREWLDSLKHDGVPRIDTFLTNALGARPSLYSRAVSKNFWLSMVARIFRPGCQMDNMLVLEGAQGIGKNRVLRAIGKDWYAQAPGTPEEKDFYLAFQGKLIVEFAELANLRKSDIEKVKSCITCPNDRYRSPYERTSKDHPRQCIFVGTTNESEWLNDSQGRRFWPVKCEEEGLINVEYVEQNREQLFAEAVERFKANETWWEVPEAAKEEQEARRIRDPWEEIIRDWLKGHPDPVSVLDVAVAALELPPERIGMLEAKRIAGCLKACSRMLKHTTLGNVWTVHTVHEGSTRKPLETNDIEPMNPMNPL